MTSKPDEEDYEKLYLVSRLVYNGEIDAEKASAKLSAILGSPEVYNKIVFSMYAGMKNGRAFISHCSVFKVQFPALKPD